jgi:hypothetical protein
MGEISKQTVSPPTQLKLPDFLQTSMEPNLNLLFLGGAKNGDNPNFCANWHANYITVCSSCENSAAHNRRLLCSTKYFSFALPRAQTVPEFVVAIRRRNALAEIPQRRSAFSFQCLQIASFSLITVEFLQIIALVDRSLLCTNTTRTCLYFISARIQYLKMQEILSAASLPKGIASMS